MHTFITNIITGLMVVGGLLGIQQTPQNLGAVYIRSIQLAPTPSNGNCLTTNGTDNAWGGCGGGGGGGGGGSVGWTWNGAGLLRMTTTTDDLLLGATATTSRAKLNVNAVGTNPAAYFNGNVGISSTTPGTALGVEGSIFVTGTVTSTSTRPSVLPYASSTMHSMTTASTTNLYVSGAPGAIALIGTDGLLGKYGGAAACTNQVVTAISAVGATTCATVTNAMLSNSSITINTSGIATGGGSVSLGSTITINASSSPTVGFVIATSTTQNSIFPYASSTAISTTYASSTFFFGAGLASCSGGNFLTFDGAGRFGCAADSVGGGGSYPFTPASNFGTTTSATTSSIWTKGVFFASSTVAASQFPYASSTALSSDFLFVNTTAKIGSLSGAVSASAGVLSAGTLSIANGGTNQTTYGTTGGMIYFDGTKLTQSAGGDPFYDAANIRFIVGRASGSFRLNSVGANGNGYFGIDSASGVTAGDIFLINTTGNVGIATTTPGAKLGVTGNVFVAGNIVSTSTTASVFPNASSTAFSATTICLIGDICRTTWPSASVSGGFAGMLTSWTNSTTLTSTSTPIAGQFYATSTTASQFPYASSTALTASSALWVGSDRKQNFSSFAFSYASSTQRSGTTTRYLAPAPNALTVNTVECEFNNFMQISLYDGTNRAEYLIASSSIGTFTYATNNTFTAKESMRVDISTTTNIAANVVGACRWKYISTN